jgi:peptide/nickel transport system permease protein
VITRISHQLGYDKPLYVQYGNYLWGVLHGDLGRTITDRRAVSSIIVENGGATLELTIAASFIAIVVGLVIGLLAGRFRDTWIDVSGRLFGIVAYAMPVFFLGFLAQLLFGIWLGWLPTSNQASPITQAFLPIHTHILFIDAIWAHNWGALWDITKHLILPATTLGIVIGGVFIRLVRVNVIRSLKDDYIEAARARGIRETSVVYRYAFRNALVPVVTVVGLQLALLLGGAILTEETFNWPGIGSTLVSYLEERDYAGVQGIVVVFALVVVVASLLIDFVNAFIDPRIRY